MKKKVLIVNSGIFKTNFIEFTNYDVRRISLFKNIRSYLKPLRIFHLKLNLPFQSIWEIENISIMFHGYDIIILHDSSSYSQLNRFIRLIDKHSDYTTKLIFYFWNTINDFSSLKFSDKWDITCFDYKDSIKFNLRYIGGFYCPFVLNNNKIVFDIFFIGINKGRFSKLFLLEEKIEEIGLVPCFIYVSKLRHLFSKRYSNPILYNEVVDYISKSKVILDFSKDGQFGLTLRVYESIYYNKKLITDNQSIDQYDFYNESNILIIKDYNDVNKIIYFLSIPFIPYSPSIFERYSLNSLISRIDNSNTIEDVRF